MIVTVVIPTYKRPEMLRLALQSVQEQSLIECVSEVIVSENSDDRASSEVISEFPRLPIKFRVQDPPVSPGEHFELLLSYVNTDWVAYLGDDDMWGRYHLQEALRCLQENSDSIAYFGRHVYISGKVGMPEKLCLHYPVPDVDNSRLNYHSHWKLYPANIAVACLTITAFNMWAMVAKRSALNVAFKAYSDPNAGLDSDRLMLWLLSKQGPIIIGKEVSLYYRIHADSGSNSLLGQSQDFHDLRAEETTLQIIDEAKRLNIPIKSYWFQSLQSLSLGHRLEFWSHSIPGAKRALLRAWPAECKYLFDTQQYKFKTLIKKFVPPLVIDLIRKLAELARL